jgi:hypothetical protein
MLRDRGGDALAAPQPVAVRCRGVGLVAVRCRVSAWWRSGAGCRHRLLKADQANACLAEEGRAASATRIAQRLLHRRHPTVCSSDLGDRGTKRGAHGHVSRQGPLSRQGPPLRLRPARPAGARLLPGAVAEIGPGSWLPPAAGTLRRRRRPAGAAPVGTAGPGRLLAGPAQGRCSALSATTARPVPLRWDSRARWWAWRARSATAHARALTLGQWFSASARLSPGSPGWPPARPGGPARPAPPPAAASEPGDQARVERREHHTEVPSAGSGACNRSRATPRSGHSDRLETRNGSSVCQPWGGAVDLLNPQPAAGGLWPPSGRRRHTVTAAPVSPSTPDDPNTYRRRVVQDRRGVNHQEGSTIK